MAKRSSKFSQSKRTPLGRESGLFAPPKTVIPLAERVRPQEFGEFVGQDHLVGENGTLRKMLDAGNVRSMILWGPPGTGKTTLARLIAGKLQADFFQINAVSSGVQELREIISTAEKSLEAGRRTILFIDEIHRFNKAQQDALLESVENGSIILIGATTENPSFEVISPLLSRSQVYVLENLGEKELRSILNRTLQHDEILKKIGDESGEGPVISQDAEQEMIRLSGGDARVMLNALEVATDLAKKQKPFHINREMIREAYQIRHYKYDRTGEEHYNSISAFIKSVRGSDPDAAVYYLARMLEAGEDPKFIARRLIILASEDIGNAEPYALTLATACFTAVDYIGMPEARIILAQATTYLSSCPKSNASYMSIERATADVREKPYLPVPLHLRNAPTNLMKELGYHKDYKYSHEFQNHFIEQQYLPDELKDRIYYEPTEIGRELTLKKYLESIWNKRKK
ncbi:MAG TPA: replication-associated recombination protein A [Candidatus Acidoferrales bacterium]|nr:replication-associated recombination protein A [Candidatus Acidoferrales bacterium]